MNEQRYEVVAHRGHLAMAAAAVVLVCAGTLQLFESRWLRPAFSDIEGQPGGWIGAIVVVVCSALVHESLHVLGWRLLAWPRKASTSLRPTWRVMGVVAHIDTPISATAFRCGLAMPATFLVGLPIVVGHFFGPGVLVLWAQFFLLECFSDVATLFATRRVPAGALVRSHPTKLGCEVLSTV